MFWGHWGLESRALLVMMFAIGNLPHMCVIIQQLTHGALVLFSLILLRTFLSSWLFMMSASYSFEWQNDWRMVNCKEFVRKWSWPNRGTIQAFTLRDYGKPRKTSDKPACVSVEIRTEYPLNTSLPSLQLYSYANPFSTFFCKCHAKTSSSSYSSIQY
jgi:hypothetical protein